MCLVGSEPYFIYLFFFVSSFFFFGLFRAEPSAYGGSQDRADMTQLPLCILHLPLYSIVHVLSCKETLKEDLSGRKSNKISWHV